MTRPRSEQVSIADTPYYHVYARCVRRGFLCGVDPLTGANYEHRRQWIVDRIHLLSSVFALDIAAYAVMSNHYHLTVKLDPDQATQWTPREVLTRWFSVYKPPKPVQKYLGGEPLTVAERTFVDSEVDLRRQRLTDLSWLMKALNEFIARQANREDGCTGHFWEARFKSQALLSEADLLTCMAYVDLNPIRAGIADTPETSDYTSIQERISAATSTDTEEDITVNNATPKPPEKIKSLLPFSCCSDNGLPCTFADYLQLVDLTGRVVRQGKRGAIPASAAPILERLSISPASWWQQATDFERVYRYKSRSMRKRSLSL